MNRRKIGRQSAETAEQTRSAILEAALNIFAVRGVEAVSLRDIAEKVNTTHALILHYFGSKEGVWQAVADAAVNQFAEALQPYADQMNQPHIDPVEATKSGMQDLLLLCARRPQIVQLIMHEGTEGGPRLDYILGQFIHVGEMMFPLLTHVQQRGYLRQFDNRSIFIYLVTAGFAPFGLPALSSWVLEANIFSEKQVLAHMDRFIQTLFTRSMDDPTST